MARREQTKDTDPDVEASRMELQTLEGQKNNAEREREAIHKSKEQLEKDFVEASSTISQKLEVARENAANQIRKICADIAEAESEKTASISRAATIQSETSRLQTTFDNLKTDVEKAIKVLADIQQDHERVTKQHISLVSQVGLCKSLLTDLESKKQELLNDISEKRAAAIRLHNSHDSLDESLQDKRQTLAALDAQILEAVQVIKNKQSDLGEANLILPVLKDQIVDLKKQATEHTVAMQKEKSERDMQMGNLARLEKRVDEKFASLKALEGEFTIEHMARVGYKPLTK